MNDWPIAQLVLDLHPVRRLPSPGRRLLRFAGLALPLLVLAAGLAGPRADLLLKLRSPSYVAETALLLLFFFAATLAALRSAVPGAGWNGAARLVILALVVWALAVAAQGFDTSPTIEPRSGLSCLRRTLLFGVAPAWALATMVRRAAPLDAQASGALVMFSASVLAVLATRVLCARDDVAHALVWHVAPVALLALVGWHAGQLCLSERGSWTRSNHGRVRDAFSVEERQNR